MFEVSNGVIELIRAAHTRDDSLKYFLHGDLVQMSAQKDALLREGINVGISGGIPGFQCKEDYKKALEIIWERSITGWFGYEDALIKYEICSKEEFEDRFYRLGDRSDLNMFARSKPTDHEGIGGWVTGVYVKNNGDGTVTLETQSGTVKCQLSTLREDHPYSKQDKELVAKVCEAAGIHSA